MKTQVSGIKLAGTNLHWDPTSGATGYLFSITDGSGRQVSKPETDTKKTSIGLQILTTRGEDNYTFVLRAKDAEGKGPESTVTFTVKDKTVGDFKVLSEAEAKALDKDDHVPAGGSVNPTPQPPAPTPTLASKPATSAADPEILKEIRDGFTSLKTTVSNGTEATVTALAGMTASQTQMAGTLKSASDAFQAGATSFSQLGKRLDGVETVGNDIREFGADVKALTNQPVKEEKRKWLRGAIIAAVAILVICLFTWWCVSHYSKGSAPVGKTPQTTNSATGMAPVVNTNGPATNDSPIQKIGTVIIPAGAAITPKKNGRKKNRSVEILDLATGKQYTTNALPLSDQQVTEIETLVEYPAGLPVAVTFDNRFSNLSNCTLSNVTINMGTQISGSTVGNHYAPPQTPIPQQGPTHDWQGSQVAPQQAPPADFQQGQPVSQVVQPTYGYAQPTYLYAQQAYSVSQPYYYGGESYPVSCGGIGLGVIWSGGYDGRYNHSGRGTVVERTTVINNTVNRNYSSSQGSGSRGYSNPGYSVQAPVRPQPCYNGSGGRSGGNQGSYGGNGGQQGRSSGGRGGGRP